MTFIDVLNWNSQKLAQLLPLFIAAYTAESLLLCFNTQKVMLKYPSFFVSGNKSLKYRYSRLALYNLNFNQDMWGKKVQIAVVEHSIQPFVSETFDRKT